MSIVNRYRNGEKLSSYVWNENLRCLLRDHMIYMMDQDAISHDNFDDRFDKIGASSAGENVAYNWIDSTDTQEKLCLQWWNSPGHKANMLGAYTDFGCMTSHYENSTKVFGAQFFASFGYGSATDMGNCRADEEPEGDGWKIEAIVAGATIGVSAIVIISLYFGGCIVKGIRGAPSSGGKSKSVVKANIIT